MINSKDQSGEEKVSFLTKEEGKFSLPAWSVLVKSVLAESAQVLNECEQFQKKEFSRFFR